MSKERGSITPETGNRLFVPLSKEAFIDFKENGKLVEIRRLKGQYNSSTVCLGRPVELRLGYSGKESIWGTIIEVAVGRLEQIIATFPLFEVEPGTHSVEEAVSQNLSIMGESENFIAFKIQKRG